MQKLFVHSGTWIVSINGLLQEMDILDCEDSVWGVCVNVKFELKKKNWNEAISFGEISIWKLCIWFKLYTQALDYNEQF